MLTTVFKKYYNLTDSFYYKKESLLVQIIYEIEQFISSSDEGTTFRKN